MSCIGNVGVSWQMLKDWAVQTDRKEDDVVKIGGLAGRQVSAAVSGPKANHAENSVAQAALMAQLRDRLGVAGKAPGVSVETAEVTHDVAENGNARAAFLSLIRQKLNLPENTPIEKFPESVRAAMKLTGFKGLFKGGDWVAENGRPLTARRILAVTQAVEHYLRVADIEKSGRLATTLEQHPEFRDMLRANPNLTSALYTNNALTNLLEQEVADGKTDMYKHLCDNADRAHPIPFGAITPSEDQKRKVCNLFTAGLGKMLDCGFEATHNAGQVAKDAYRELVHIDYTRDPNAGGALTLTRPPDEGASGEKHVKAFIDGLVDERSRMNLPNEDKFVNALMSLCHQGFIADLSTPEFADVMGFPKFVVGGGNNTDIRFSMTPAKNGSVRFEVDIKFDVLNLTPTDANDISVIAYDKDNDPAQIGMKLAFTVNRGDEGRPVLDKDSVHVGDMKMTFPEPNADYWD